MTEKQKVDWDKLRRRLDISATALGRAIEGQPENADEILRRRAERLARRVETPPTDGASPVLVFRLGNERYGIEVARLLEVIANPLCTPVPGGPAHLWGVLHVRGEIRPVWDLYRMLGLPAPEPGGPEHVLLLRGRDGAFGARVGAVEDILLLTPPPEAAKPSRPYVKWVSKDSIAVLSPEGLETRKEDE